MAKKKITNSYPFYEALRYFFLEKEREIRKFFTPLSRKILDFNDKRKNPKAFLRTPQFEALQTYVMVKELLNNRQMCDIFADWYNKRNAFDSRGPFNSRNIQSGGYFQGNFFDDLTRQDYEDVFDLLKAQGQSYPNYIYALTMGTGKTILMATCIYYEFLLAKKYPDDKRFCHNALIFAPDKTVLDTILTDIRSFDIAKVIPGEYVGFLITNIKYHFLEDTLSSLNTIDGSDFNIIISNTQKIILKEKHTEANAVDKLLSSKQISLDLERDDGTKSLYCDLNFITDEKDVQINQRFEKIIRLNQLGIYVDEAHHLFGKELASALSDTTKESSLRYTINKIADALRKRSTNLVACYNYTGTPYVENTVLPEVVYSYGLQKAINNGYLKEVSIQGYENVKNEEFLRRVLTDFFTFYKGKFYEGLNPKIAIYGSSVEEVVTEIKPIVEGILNDIGIDLNAILVNVGDNTVTKDSDIRNFNDLDTIGSEGNKKQVILLVNKGKEGWNCRSLFAVALFRSPKSKVFVLQSTMRCLRSITEDQQKAHVYLSFDNYKILDAELKKNFNVTIQSVNNSGLPTKTEYTISIVPPVLQLTLHDLKKKYVLTKNNVSLSDFKFDCNALDLNKYKSRKIVKEGLDERSFSTTSEFVSDENRPLSGYQIIFEVSRYLNEDVLEIDKMLHGTANFDEIVKLISQYNGILYDELIPTVFEYLYTIREKTEAIERKVPLIQYPKGATHFTFKSSKELTLYKSEHLVQEWNGKSFHTDRYCFDSKPEMKLFLDLIKDPFVDKIYFTGMFTGSENGLSVQYIDPESNVIRNYYPDFLVYYKDGSVDVIEVKGDNRIDAAEVMAKSEAMAELAKYSEHMDYKMVKSSEIMNNSYLSSDGVVHASLIDQDENE